MIFFLYICVCSRSSWQARRRSGLGHATRASQKHLAITSLSPPSLSSSGTYQKKPVLFFLFLFRASFSFLIRTHSNCALGLELYNWTVHIGAANYAYPFAPHMFMHRYILINIWSVENEASEFLCICSPFNSQQVRRCFNFVFHLFLFFPCIMYCVMWSACAYICTSRSITVYRAVDDVKTGELILELTEHGDKKDFSDKQVEFLEIHFVHACGKCTIRARVPRCHGSNVFLKKSNWDNACMYIKYDQHRNLQSILWCLFQLICIVFVYILPLHVYVCMYVCMSH
jgi:hypothetical protein